ncbi:MAG: Conserved cytoplasmic membrane protein, CmpX protein [Parcubacteria group bacterium GW2011_GWB1_52_7]|nr:MAG: Conserved cytoplasmic membrane protein, CmpX protein [Parcubacteria group bacterium GW2011_GWB1_52_7]
MVLQTWGDVIILSLQEVWASVAGFLPLLIGALVVFVIGWIVAVSLGKVIEQIVKALKVDSVLEKLELHKVLDRAGIQLNSGAFIGGLVRWFLIVVFLLAALNILNLNEVSAFLRDVLGYIPQVVVAALILVIAALLAETAERTARASVEAAGLKGALVGVVTRWAIWIFAIIAALYQLGVATLLLQTLLTGLVAMLAIAGGLAFGLGGKDLAGDFLGRVRREISDRS